MFIDHAIIFCYAGDGGNGCNSYERLNHMKHNRPTGGDGGRGGSVIIVAKQQVRTLLDVQMRKTFYASNGKHGGSNHKTGGEGSSFRVEIPVGTEVFNNDTGHLLKDMCVHNEELVVCIGGEGGKGNHRRSDAAQGDKGEVKTIRLELKLIADVGLIGIPNAGKSTLISRISNAKSKIAAFPFTTKEPVLGVVKSLYGDSFVIADIPGLIKGASEGKGLGHEFLRHIERTKILIHVIDMAAVEGRDPISDYHVINEELAQYSKALQERPRIIVANKMDIPEAANHLARFKEATGEELLEMSAATGKGLKELGLIIFETLNKQELT